MDILEEVNAKYDSLSQVQKRIADYIFIYPDEVCFGSLKALSASLGVTEVTILRFVKKIGLSSFVELKTCLRDHIQGCLRYDNANANGIPKLVGKEESGGQDKEALLREFAANEQEVVKKTYGKIAVNEVTEAVSLIKQARYVYVAAGDLLKPVSAHMTRRLLSVGVKTIDLGSVNMANFQAYVSGIGPEDAAIFFTLPGYTKTLVNAAKYLRKNHVPLIVVTDKKVAPTATYATTVLLCDHDDPFFYNSSLGAFSVANLLAYFTAIENLSETVRMRRRISEAREAVREENSEVTR